MLIMRDLHCWLGLYIIWNWASLCLQCQARIVVRPFEKPPKLILDWGQRGSWDEPTGPNFKGDIFSFLLNENYVLLLFCSHRNIWKLYNNTMQHKNRTVSTITKPITLYILHSIRKFRVTAMNLWDSSCFKWEGAGLREAPAVLRTVNLQAQIRTRKPIKLVANVTESR
jgi:hypothetical protein